MKKLSLMLLRPAEIRRRLTRSIAGASIAILLTGCAKLPPVTPPPPPAHLVWERAEIVPHIQWREEFSEKWSSRALIGHVQPIGLKIGDVLKLDATSCDVPEPPTGWIRLIDVQGVMVRWRYIDQGPADSRTLALGYPDGRWNHYRGPDHECDYPPQSNVVPSP